MDDTLMLETLRQAILAKKSRACKGLMPKREFFWPEGFNEAFSLRLFRTLYEAEVNAMNYDYVYNDKVADHIQMLSDWFSGEGPNNLLMMGYCGTGKSTLLNVIADFLDFKRIRFFRASANVLTNQYEQLRDASSFCKEAWNADILLLDDLGSEHPESISYAQELFPITDLLSHRYNLRLMTFITTNLDPEQIKNRYGHRILDRLTGDYTCEVFNSTSFRTMNLYNTKYWYEVNGPQKQ